MILRFVVLSFALFTIPKVKAQLCRYSDACNSSPISAQRGGTLTDSCGNTWSVSSSCDLSFLRRETPNPSPHPSQVGLSPPWFELQRIFSYTIGQSSRIIVSTLKGGPQYFSILVVTLEEQTAQSLANVFKNSFYFGGVEVSVEYTDVSGQRFAPSGPPSLDDLKTALLNNPLVDGVAEKEIACVATVIQFFNDDISNPDLFTSMIASEGFNQIVVDGVSAFTIGKKLINI